MSEKILLHYKKNTVYDNDPTVQIGTDADFLSLFPTKSVLRTVTADATGTTNYVRKFGLALSITGCTAIDEPTANMTIAVYALDGTLLGSRTNGGAFTAGSACTAQGVYLIVSASGGAGTLAATESITLTGRGALTVNFATETVADSDSLTLYLAHSGSTYYDSGMIYGGARHTPSAGSEDLPYFTPKAALGALGGGRTIMHILDSATYDEVITVSGSYTIQAELNQTPIFTSGIGCRITIECSAQWNNTMACYWNENGDDGTGDGTWQTPYETPATAITNRGSLNVIYGGAGATVSGCDYTTGTLTINNFYFESDYGYMPKLRPTNTPFYKIITLTNGYLRGFIIEGLITASNFPVINCEANNNNKYILDCSVYYQFIRSNNDESDYAFTVKNTEIISAKYGIQFFINEDNGVIDLDIEKNYISDISDSAISFEGTSFIDGQVDGEIKNNVLYNFKYGIGIISMAGGALTFNADIKNNTLRAKNKTLTIGFWCQENTTTFNGSYEKNIITNCGYGILCLSTITIDYNCLYDNTTNISGVGVTNNNPVTTDMIFCDSDNAFYGLSVDSSCYKTDGAEGDIGAILYNILLAANNIILNGFKIDGQNKFFNAILKTGSSDYSGTDYKWINVYDFTGIQIDDYSGASTNSDVYYNLIHNGGCGIKHPQGGNNIKYNVIFKNKKYNCHINNTTYDIQYDVFYNAEYGLFLESACGGIVIKNIITDTNSIYGIYSEILLKLTYCCITDAVNSLIDISDTSNINYDPFFVSTNDGEENFNIKTIELGYTFNSACKDAGNSDIGAYQIDRSIDDENWQKYQLEFNPETVNETNYSKGLIINENANGQSFLYGKSHKKQMPLIWTANRYTSEIQWKTLKYISSLIQTRENNLKKAECEIRFHYLPSAKIKSGTGAVVSGKTLTDAGLTLIDNELKGFWAGIKYTSGSGTGTISAAGKTLTVNPSPGWTVDEWTGYYFYYGYNYYYIKSNAASVLTLSDPDGTLVNANNIDWTIEKYFKILSNTETVLTLEDDDDELIAGTYDYYIDFILCSVIDSNFTFTQNRYKFDREHSKTGYQLLLEEK